MIRASIWLVTAWRGTSLPLPTMTARMRRFYPVARGAGAGLRWGGAQAGRRGAGLRGGGAHALRHPRRSRGGGVLIPPRVHSRLNEGGRRVPPRVREPALIGVRGDRRLERSPGRERPLPREPRPALRA